MENTKKLNTVERLSRRLKENFPQQIEQNYLDLIKDSLPDNPVILVDDTDIIKPYGKKFESLGVVRDGSSRRVITKKDTM